MKFSFVIPTYKNYALIHQVLWDIYKNCSSPYEIIVVDDAGDTETINGLSWWKTSLFSQLIHYVQSENLGFLKNSNSGLLAATGDVICLVSTDVRIHKDITTASMYLADDPKQIIGTRLLSYDTGWNKFGNKVFPYLEGWLLCATSQAWKELNYFDERFAPNDFEDVDFSTKAVAAGYRLTELTEYATHIGGQSLGYSPERESLTIENKRKFKEKWNL